MNMMFVEAGVEYAKDYCEGKIKEKNNKEAFIKKCSEAAQGKQMQVDTYKGTDKNGKEIKFDNFYMILSDFITF